MGLLETLMAAVDSQLPVNPRAIKGRKPKRLSGREHRGGAEPSDWFLSGLQTLKAPACCLFGYVSSNFQTDILYVFVSAGGVAGGGGALESRSALGRELPVGHRPELNMQRLDESIQRPR